MITNPLLIGSTTSDPACGACAARSWTDDVGACGLAAAVAAPATNRHGRHGDDCRSDEFAHRETLFDHSPRGGRLTLIGAVSPRRTRTVVENGTKPSLRTSIL